jgi:hypothetical protein
MRTMAERFSVARRASHAVMALGLAGALLLLGASRAQAGDGDFAHQPAGESFDLAFMRLEQFYFGGDTATETNFGVLSWPARRPYGGTPTMFGMPFGYSVDITLGLRNAIGGAGEIKFRVGVQASAMLELVRLGPVGLAAAMHVGAATIDDNVESLYIGPGIQVLAQLAFLRLLAQYRVTPWMVMRAVMHEARVAAQFQLGDTFFVGAGITVRGTTLERAAGQRDRGSFGFGLEFGGVL